MLSCKVVDKKLHIISVHLLFFCPLECVYESPAVCLWPHSIFFSVCCCVYCKRTCRDSVTYIIAPLELVETFPKVWSWTCENDAKKQVKKIFILLLSFGSALCLSDFHSEWKKTLTFICVSGHMKLLSVDCYKQHSLNSRAAETGSGRTESSLHKTRCQRRFFVFTLVHIFLSLSEFCPSCLSSHVPASPSLASDHFHIFIRPHRLLGYVHKTRGCKVTKQALRKFPQRTNIDLDLKMSWFEFGGQRSQNTFLARHTLIMRKFHTNV